MESFIVKLEKVNVHQRDKCPRMFTNTEELKTHNAKHDLKEKLYRARFLDHMLSSKVILKRVEIHQCKECPRCFLHYARLNEHQKEHYGQEKLYEDNNNDLKPHKCEECGQRFVKMSTLDMHLKVHDPDFCEKQSQRAKDAFPKLNFKSEKSETKHRASSYRDDSKLPKNKYGDYECNFCGQVYKNETRFFAHVNTHTGKWSHVCDKCPYGCKTEAMLIVHKKVHDRGFNGTWKCSYCKKVFNCKGTLITHTLVHTNEKLYACTICPKSFAQSGAFKVHMNRHAGIYAFKCKQCEKSFVYKGALDLHERTHSGYKPFDCKFCGKEFSDPSAFKRHTRIHTGEKPHICLYCPKSFSDNSAWIVHIRRHEGFTYTCKICSIKLPCINTLRKHITDIHEKIQSYECDYCGVIKNNKYKLSGHIKRIHMKMEYRYHCKYCPKMSHFKSTLVKHESVHKRNDYYGCLICGHYCRSEGSLKNHITLNHSNIEDKYKCAHCKARFSDNDSLKSHLTHCRRKKPCKKCKKQITSQKQHKCLTCRVCGDYFKTEALIKIHYKSHFKQIRFMKKYGCSECPEKFYEVTALEKHRLERHGATFCDHCGEKFDGKAKLRNHIWIRHMLSLYCNVCMKRFYAEHDFRRHKIIGCARKVRCKICKNNYFKSALEAHVMTRHPFFVQA